MDPFNLAVLYLFLEFGRPQDLIPGVSVFHLPALITVLIAAYLLGSRRPAPVQKETKLFVLLLVLMAFHVPFARNNYWALQIALTMLQTFVAYLSLTTAVVSFDRFRKLIVLWLGIHVYLAIVGIMKNGQGVGGFLGDENDFAFTMNMALPFAYFGMLAETDRMKKWLYAGAAMIIVAANVVSLSRGGFLGLVAVTLFCWWRSPRKFVSATFIAAMVLVVLAAAPPRYWQEIRSIQKGTADPTGRARTYFWGIGWDMFLANPVLGVGQGNFPYRFREYEVADGFEDGLDGTSGAGRAAHSLYFTVLPELGLVGTVAWSLMVIAIVQSTRRVRHIRRKAGKGDRASYMSLAIEGSLVGYLVSGTFISVLYYPNLWILTAFAVALRMTASGQQEGVEQSSRYDLYNTRLPPAFVATAVLPLERSVNQHTY